MLVYHLRRYIQPVWRHAEKLGIECTFIDANASEEEIDQAFRPNTKALFGETISNPSIDVLDIEKFARIAHKHGVPLIVDNTFATPINCRPFEWGADIVTHSTTKYMDGHATSVEAPLWTAATLTGKPMDKFPGLTQPDESYHGLTYTKAFGKMAYMTKATAQLMRDLGSIQSPQNAFLLNLGIGNITPARAPSLRKRTESGRMAGSQPESEMGELLRTEKQQIL